MVGWSYVPLVGRGLVGLPRPRPCTSRATITSSTFQLGRALTRRTGSGGNASGPCTRRRPLGRTRSDAGERDQEDSTLPPRVSGRTQPALAYRHRGTHEDRRTGVSLARG